MTGQQSVSGLDNPERCRLNSNDPSGLRQVAGDVGDVAWRRTAPFSVLRRVIGSISQRMLTLSSVRIEQDGLIKRVMTPSVPPRFDFELTTSSAASVSRRAGPDHRARVYVQSSHTAFESALTKLG